jgi:hypothetical protein
MPNYCTVILSIYTIKLPLLFVYNLRVYDLCSFGFSFHLTSTSSNIWLEYHCRPRSCPEYVNSSENSLLGEHNAPVFTVALWEYVRTHNSCQQTISNSGNWIRFGRGLYYGPTARYLSVIQRTFRLKRQTGIIHISCTKFIQQLLQKM